VSTVIPSFGAGPRPTKDALESSAVIAVVITEADGAVLRRPGTAAPGPTDSTAPPAAAPTTGCRPRPRRRPRRLPTPRPTRKPQQARSTPRRHRDRRRPRRRGPRRSPHPSRPRSRLLPAPNAFTSSPASRRGAVHFASTSTGSKYAWTFEAWDVNSSSPTATFGSDPSRRPPVTGRVAVTNQDHLPVFVTRGSTVAIPGSLLSSCSPPPCRDRLGRPRPRPGWTTNEDTAVRSRSRRDQERTAHHAVHAGAAAHGTVGAPGPITCDPGAPTRHSDPVHPAANYNGTTRSLRRRP
jgi:hypothetical protein